MTKKSKLEIEYTTYVKEQRSQSKPELSIGDWYKQKSGKDLPDFLKPMEGLSEEKVQEYLLGILGKEPMASGARRRWRFLKSLAKYIAEVQEVTFQDLAVWVARNLETMKFRTLKEDYIEYLAVLGVVEWDESTKLVKWVGRGFADAK
jgi:hypothetical protein